MWKLDSLREGYLAPRSNKDVAVDCEHKLWTGCSSQKARVSQSSFWGTGSPFRNAHFLSSWPGEFTSATDSCFPLFFLNKSFVEIILFMFHHCGVDCLSLSSWDCIIIDIRLHTGDKLYRLQGYLLLGAVRIFHVKGQSYGELWLVQTFYTESDSRGRECWIFWISSWISGIHPLIWLGLKMPRTLFPVEERALIIHGCVLAIQIHKISAFSPNQQLIRSTELSDSGSGIFEHFLKTNQYNNVGWLLVMSLDKVVREEGELRDSISQLRDHRDDLKTSLWVLGDFVSLEVSGLAITENQMRTVTLWMAELRKSWTPSLSRHPLIKWGHCLGKTLTLQIGMVICRKTRMKLRTLSPWILVNLLCQWKKSPNPHSVILASPAPSEGINLVLPEETVAAAPEAAVLQDTADSPQDPAPNTTPLLLHIQPQSLHTSKGEEQWGIVLYSKRTIWIL